MNSLYRVPLRYSGFLLLTYQVGDTVIVHWSGYTSGYQAKRIDNTSTRDEPFEFVLGSDEVIGAFNELVAGMKVGGLRRMEVPGETRGNEKLSYALDQKVQRIYLFGMF